MIHINSRAFSCLFLACVTLVIAIHIEVNAFVPQSHVGNQVLSFPPSHAAFRYASRLAALSFDRPKSYQGQKPKERFDRTASREIRAETECILTIEGTRYNMTAWAKAHPGGESIIKRFHGKDATKAFHAAAHSKKAYEMLARFAIDDVPSEVVKVKSKVPRWRRKLFTKEGTYRTSRACMVESLHEFA